MKNEKMIGAVLLLLGALWLLGGARLDSGFVFLALIGAAFLWAYAQRRQYGQLVAGGILTGLAVGSFLETLLRADGFVLLGLAGGFYLIDRVAPRPSRWPLYPAVVLAVIAFLTAFSGSLLLPLLLIATGLWMLYRDGRLPVDRWRSSFFPEPTARPAPVPPQPTRQGVRTIRLDKTPEGMMTVEVVPHLATPVVAPVAASTVQGRLERLTLWRNETAALEARAPYFVLRDESLKEIAEANPQTWAELENLPSVGPVKLEHYGTALLEALKGQMPPRIVN